MFNMKRNPRKAFIAGVCAAIAECNNQDLTSVRMLTIIAMILSGGTALLIYIALTFMIPIGDSKSKGLSNRAPPTDPEQLAHLDRMMEKYPPRTD